GIEKDGFFAARRNPIDLAVRGRTDIKRALAIKSNRLGGKVTGLKDSRSFSVAIQLKYFCRRAARRVGSTVGMQLHRPEVGRIGVGQLRELWREFQAAVAAHCDSSRAALQEFVITRLAPATSVLRSHDTGRGGQQCHCAYPCSQPPRATTR